jgi:hypothetical protein
MKKFLQEVFSSEAACEENCLPEHVKHEFEPNMGAVRAEMQIIAQRIRVEMREYCDSLYCDLEDRLKNYNVQLQREVKSQGDRETNSSQESTTEQIPSSEKKCCCSKDLVEPNVDEQALSSNLDMCAGPFPIERGSPDDKAELDANLVSRISDQVTTEVNAKLEETHQSIHECFAKLLDMIQQAPWAEPKSKKADSTALSHRVTDTQKQCKSISLELRQFRQRWNQHVSRTEVRLGKLEDALQTTQGQDISDLTIRKDSSTTSLSDADILKQFPETSEASADEATPVTIDGSDSP